MYHYLAVKDPKTKRLIQDFKKGLLGLFKVVVSPLELFSLLYKEKEDRRKPGIPAFPRTVSMLPSSFHQQLSAKRESGAKPSRRITHFFVASFSSSRRAAR